MNQNDRQRQRQKEMKREKPTRNFNPQGKWRHNSRKACRYILSSRSFLLFNATRNSRSCPTLSIRLLCISYFARCSASAEFRSVFFSFFFPSKLFSFLPFHFTFFFGLLCACVCEYWALFFSLKQTPHARVCSVYAYILCVCVYRVPFLAYFFFLLSVCLTQSRVMIT